MAQRTCSIEGCDGPVHGWGWCNAHYIRWKKRGSTDSGRPVHVTMFGAPSERFWAKVDRSAGHDGCWPWTGLFFRGGYGRFWVGPGIDIPAHVWAWEQVNGPVPAGLQLDHFRCDNPPCVNPAHLRPTTPRENTLRGNTITAFNLAKTHCPQDHPYDETNTYWRRDGARACRKCQRVFQAAYEQRRRGSSS